MPPEEPFAAEPEASLEPPDAPQATAPAPSAPAPMAAQPAVSSEWPQEDTQAHDPLLEGWEGGVAGGPDEEPYQGGGELFGEPDEQPKRRGKGGEEPSLRELFWGEE